MGSGWDPSTSLHPAPAPVGGHFRTRRPSNLPLCSLVVPLQIKDTVTMDAGRANKEAEILRKQCKALCQELKEALQEADVAKCRRDWAFQERDKIVAERDSIRYGCWGPHGLRSPRDAVGLWESQSLCHLLPGLVGVTWVVLLTLGDVPVLPHSENFEFSITSQLPISLYPRCPNVCCVQSIDPHEVAQGQAFILGGFWCN